MDREEFLNSLGKQVTEKRVFERLAKAGEFPKIRRSEFLLNGPPLDQWAGLPPPILLAMEDATEME
jgi:hypothetical protein